MSLTPPPSTEDLRPPSPPSTNNDDADTTNKEEVIYNHSFENDDDDEEDYDENDYYLQLIKFKSIRNKDGLEEAISVSWDPQRSKKDDIQDTTTLDSSSESSNSSLLLSTLLEPDELAPLFAGAQWAGTRVWHAAICGTLYLQNNYASHVLAESSLLELGCGLGVPGMIASKYLGTKYVLLTDQESIMSQLLKNLQTNDFHFCGNKEDDTPRNTVIQAEPLDWSRSGVQSLVKDKQSFLSNNSGSFDIVLNCDCIYEPLYGSSWKLLVEVLEECLRQNPDCICLTSVERRAADGIDDFCSMLSSSPVVSKVECVFEDVPYKIQIYQAFGINSRLLVES